MDRRPLFIHGRSVRSTGTESMPVLDKSTGQTIAHVPGSTAIDVAAAVDSAQNAFREWSRKPARKRSSIMHKAASAVRAATDELANMLTAEVGKPLSDAKREVNSVASALDFFAEEGLRVRGEIPQLNLPDEQVLIVKEPVGVVVAITPANYPLTLLSWKLGAALAVGCTLVAKPAEETPLATLRLAELLVEAGLPPGVFNVVTGHGDTTGKALVTHPIPRKVAFTDGAETGKEVAALAAQTNKLLTLELGGQCPAVICKDADLDVAVPAIARSSFRNAGQHCYRVNRMYAQSNVYNEVVKTFVGAVRTL